MLQQKETFYSRKAAVLVNPLFYKIFV